MHLHTRSGVRSLYRGPAGHVRGFAQAGNAVAENMAPAAGVPAWF
ncbi:MAG: hypothetical protein P8090_13650 [Gammaproteobacteria bacterium]